MEKEENLLHIGEEGVATGEKNENLFEKIRKVILNTLVGEKKINDKEKQVNHVENSEGIEGVDSQSISDKILSYCENLINDKENTFAWTDGDSIIIDHRRSPVMTNPKAHSGDLIWNWDKTFLNMSSKGWKKKKYYLNCITHDYNLGKNVFGKLGSFDGDATRINIEVSKETYDKSILLKNKITR